MKILFFLSYIIMLASCGIIINDIRKPTKSLTHNTTIKLTAIVVFAAFFIAVSGFLWVVT